MESTKENLITSPCLLCDSNDFTHLIDWVDRHHLTVSLSICNKCGLRQLNPRMNSKELDQFYSSKYYSLYSMDNKSKSDKWVKRKQGIAKGILDAVEKHRSLKGLRLLDIGCGHGFLINEARQRGAIVAGVEPSVKHAKRLLDKGFDVHTGTLEQFINTKPGLYDIVVSSHVLEHSDKPCQFLQCASNLLTHGGLLCAEVPNAEWQTTYGSHPVSIHTAHLAYHTERTLKALFETSGLEVLSVSFGLNGGSVRAVSQPGPVKALADIELDDPLDVTRETIRAFKRHTSPWPFNKLHYAVRVARKEIVKLRFKHALKTERDG
jgi:2-polyprenyl-3-methyl-5-hydroxy-6-metoxy-1,4-benzoquinol methylase